MWFFKKKKIGLALGSGAARGLAHIGVIKELEKNNIPIDCIAGSSIGAIVGGLYAYTKDIRLIEDIASSNNFKSLFSAFFDPSFQTGIFKGEKVLDLLNGYIPDNAEIKDTKIPFCAVGSDLITAKSVIITDGNLKEAIRASMSIPVLLSPIKYKDSFLIDGGTTDPVPVDAVKQLGATKVIAVNIYTNLFPKDINNLKLNMVEMLRIMIEMSLYNTALANMEDADVRLNLPVERDLPLTAFAQDPSKIIKIGEDETKKYLNKLKKL
jgi:NTE family protein